MSASLVRECLRNFKSLFLLYNGLGLLLSVAILFRHSYFVVFATFCALPWAVIPPIVDAFPPKIRNITWFHFLVSLIGCFVWVISVQLDWLDISELYIGSTRLSVLSLSFAFHMSLLCLNALFRTFTSGSLVLVSISAPLFSVPLQLSTSQTLARLDPSSVLQTHVVASKQRAKRELKVAPAFNQSVIESLTAVEKPAEQ